MDYQPLDIDAARNASVSVIPGRQAAPRGFQRFHGLPFQIGDGERAIIALGGDSPGTVRIPVDCTAHSILVAHRLLESRILEGALPGGLVATYRVTYADGVTEDIPIRERFEIAAPLGWGQLPFAAVPDQKNATIARWEGRWGDAGHRQTEAEQGASLAYFIWRWPNPRFNIRVASIDIVPAGPRFVVAAMTLGHIDENPLTHSGAVPVRVDLKDPAIAARPTDGASRTGLDIQVDRGVAGYAFPLPTRSPDEFLADGMAGWGERQNPHASPAYAEVAAAPSATIALVSNGEAIDAARFGDLVERRVIETPRSRIAIVEQGRNWVETVVIDDAIDRPVPCRVHFRSRDGVPYQPHGHHGHVNSNNGTWHIDIGGDLRLGQISYAYIDGRCQGWLPRGEVIVDVARGYEYEPLRQRVTIAPGQRRLELRLRRMVDMNARRWFSGDTHVHFLSTQGSHFEARGEDLNVVNLLLSQWGNLFTNTEEFTGAPSISRDGRTIVWATQENRQHLLGHLTLLGLKEAVYPWCSDGPGEAELGGTLDVTMSHWADACRAQGGTVILPHLPNPNGEPAAMIATGRVDGVEMIRQADYNHLEYYRYLNAGYRLPLVGGTDKMSSDVAVGQYRTYVRIPADEEFSYDSWCANLKRGRTFLSGGPMIEFTVDGQEIGDTLRLTPGGGSVEVVARATSTIPIHTLQIVERGQVVAQTDDAAGSRRLELRTRLTIERHSWLCARVSGPGYGGITHHDCWTRGVFAHTSPIYLAVGGEWEMADSAGLQYMLTMVDGSLKYIRDLSPRRPSESTTHHHGEADHQAYLERPFLQAREALHRRMHALGIGH
ncbi:MAG: hypothetical protein EPO26_07485 [Chloroflexota bacterium]|nr:MAG: hypothetical protein EPO26_07485 [Chloroflexota bacterium]